MGVVARGRWATPAPEELFDCYIESLQPLARRRASLETYGIAACGCERCLLEAAVLDPGAVDRVLEAAARARTDAAEPAAQAALAEEAAELADATVATALERHLRSGAPGPPSLAHTGVAEPGPGRSSWAGGVDAAHAARPPPLAVNGPNPPQGFVRSHFSS